VLIPVVAATNQGKPRHTLSRRSRARVPLLAYTPESGLGRIVRDQRQSALDAAGADPVFTAHLATVLKSMALDGRGIAWLPQSLMQEELASGRLVDAGGPDWHLPIAIRLFRHRAAGAASAEAFWRAVVARSASR